jgi:cell division protease FtsH
MSGPLGAWARRLLELLRAGAMSGPLGAWARRLLELLRDPKRRRVLVAAASIVGVSLLLRRPGRRAALGAAASPGAGTAGASTAASAAAASAAAAAAAAAASVPARLRVPFSEFLQRIERGEVGKVLLGEHTLEFHLKEQVASAASAATQLLFTKPIRVHPGIVELLHSKGVSFDELIAAPAARSPRSPLQTALMVALPAAYLTLLGYVIKTLYDQTAGGDVGTLSSGRNVATSSSPSVKRTSFADVAGSAAAREVVEEVADILKNPERYARVGARLPTGILLIGPPGTGKTMLARAMANECGLPFFFCSGSDFVEVYAGRGASRVRSLFARAAKQAPCIVFIDEIDALGKSRSGEISMNEEREQTLNQLLAAMDGFCSDKRVVIMAATNRYDVLDKALVRPGRFDRIVKVDLPDQAGRQEILKVHSRHMRLSEDCDLALIAGLTPDYTGAELSMICNEAAIRAARDKREELLTEDFMVALRTHKASTKRGAKAGRSGSELLSGILNSIRQDPLD